MPKLLVKWSIHTTRSRSLCWSHLKQCRFNLISSKVTGQYLMHVTSNPMYHHIKTVLNLVTYTYIKQTIKIVSNYFSYFLHLLHPLSIHIFNSMNMIPSSPLRCFRMKFFCIFVYMLQPNNSRSLGPENFLFHLAFYS